MNKNELDELIKSTYNFEDGLKPCLDGIINKEEYSKCKHKILWILWEPHNHTDGGEDSREDINKNIDEYFKYGTWRNIAYTSYGILNNKYYNEIESPANVLKSIAFINVNKYPYGTQSDNVYPRLNDIYNNKNCKTVLLKQIEYCNPEIIIGANTLYLFAKDLGLNTENESKIDFNEYLWEKNSQLFIDSAKHPGRKKGAKAISYCNEIIEAATIWLKKNK